MTNTSNSDAPAQVPPDVFDMERLEKMPASQETAGPSTAVPVTSRGLKAMTSWHFGLAVATVATVWIAWPHVFPSDAATEQAVSHLILPATAESQSQKPDTHPVVVADAEPYPPAPAVLPDASVPADLVSPPSTRTTPLAPVAPPTQSHMAPRRVRTTAKRTQLRVQPADAATTKFSINTVYAGQAWIQDDERTYVVQAGDTLKGIFIVSIDARGRSVITSQGVIR